MSKGVIAAGNRYVAEAGAEILKAGGNAFDAAIAAAWASFVAEPGATGAGGGGFMNTYTSSGSAILYDFFVQTPFKKRSLAELDFYPVDLDFGDAVHTFHAGMGSIATPGNIAGMFYVHQHLGSMPMSELVQPAIALARFGVPIDAFLEWYLRLIEPVGMSGPGGKEFFRPEGKALGVGEKFKIPDFANLLEIMAKEGPDLFYRGDLAKALVKDNEEKGGHLGFRDLEDYQVIERKPLRFAYHDHEVLTNPPPSAGGTLMAFTLKLLKEHDLANKGFGSGEHLSLLANAMRLTRMARADRFDDFVHDPQLDRFFLEDQYVAGWGTELNAAINKFGSTTHFSVLDKAGNYAAMTASLGESAGYVLPGSGLLMNNMLGEEDLNPNGFHLWPEGHRITSMMAPTILLREGKPFVALGTGGSSRIRSALVQVISNLADFKMGLKEAISSPRIHWESQTLDIEPGFSTESLSGINLPGKVRKVFWKDKAFYFGGVHSVSQEEGGKISGYGDSRRAGAVAP